MHPEMPPTKVTLTTMFRCDGIAKIYPGDYRKASKAAIALILKCAEAKIREKYPIGTKTGYSQ